MDDKDQAEKALHLQVQATFLPGQPTTRVALSRNCRRPLQVMREIRVALRRDGFKTPLPSKMRLCDAKGRQLTEDVVRDKGLASYEDEILQLHRERRDWRAHYLHIWKNKWNRCKDRVDWRELRDKGFFGAILLGILVAVLLNLRLVLRWVFGSLFVYVLYMVWKK
jgi:hypothetical protein